MGTVQSADASPQLPGLVEAVSCGDFPTDVLLVAADGVKVGAHSLICAAISQVLRAALAGSFKESTSKEINLDYTSAVTIEKMLSFAIGTLKETDISGDDAMDLMPLADRLDYEPLRSACERVLLSLLTSSNAADLLACASESNCTHLAQMAKVVVDSGSISNATRVLVDKKRQLTIQRGELARDHDEARKALDVIEKHIRDLNNQIDHEVEEVFQQTLTAFPQDIVGQSSEDDVHPPYPHSPKRTLVALPDSWTVRSKRNQQQNQKRDAMRKKYESFEPLVYESFDDALEASLPGDVIMLAKGVHHPDSSLQGSGIIKSIQIIGTEKGVVFQAPPLGPKSLFSVDGADVCIRNVEIRHTRRAAFTVRQGGNLWFEDCKVWRYQSRYSGDTQRAPVTGVVVTPSSSAHIKRCVIDTTSASAVLVHPLAENVSISDCMFRGSGSGEQDDGRFHDKRSVPGEAGSVEVCDFSYTGEEENGYPDGTSAQVKLTLVRTNIASCFGPALTYRTRHSMSPSKHFSWPANSSVSVKGNIFRNNGLAREEGSTPDGEVVVFNDFPECFDREPGMLQSTDVIDNYQNLRHVQRF